MEYKSPVDEPLVHDAVPAQEVRGSLPHAVALGRLDRRAHDAGVIREPQIVVTAKREEFPAFHHDARPLRAFARKAAPQQPLSPDIGEPVSKALKDHGGEIRGPAQPRVLIAASALARHIGQARL